MNSEKQIIKCDVYDCKHCDINNITCNLKEIKVCNRNHNNDKESTMCNSYKSRKTK